jgi:hypothetical protein
LKLAKKLSVGALSQQFNPLSLSWARSQAAIEFGNADTNDAAAAAGVRVVPFSA